MGIRITQSLLTQRTLQNLNNSLIRLSKLQEQLATGVRVNRPSDDPVDARRAIDIRTTISKTEQYISNLTDLQPTLNASENVLSSTVNIMQRVTELTVRAANGTEGQEALNASANEIDQLLEQVFLIANEKLSDRSLFGGTITTIDAFVATRDPVTDEITGVTYQGNDGEIEVQFSDETTLSVNLPGDEVFQDAVDIFDMLIGIRDDMRSGDQDSLSMVRLDQLDTAQQQVLSGLSKIGAVQNRITEISDKNEDFVLDLREQLSQKIDADFAETVLAFQTEQNGYNAALSASARVLQNSLLDFIR